ncbi:MAG: pyridoxamine 5'-phosphate oxidase [Gammaproteobacteria bacterium]
MEIHRKDYMRSELDVCDLATDPYLQFELWSQATKEAGVEDPQAMALATVSPDGTPSCRMVLLRGVSNIGFEFHTNYDSRKGAELTANPRASVLFYWPALKRQVRIEGVIERMSAVESDAYFASRPHANQLSAWASPQSQRIRDREMLEERLQDAARRFPTHVPRPPNWGGFRLLPNRFEFWQARESRLHDRFCYLRTGKNSWTIERLAP